jgi:hypothetical protein
MPDGRCDYINDNMADGVVTSLARSMVNGVAFETAARDRGNVIGP